VSKRLSKRVQHWMCRDAIMVSLDHLFDRCVLSIRRFGPKWTLYPLVMRFSSVYIGGIWWVDGCDVI